MKIRNPERHRQLLGRLYLAAGALEVLAAGVILTRVVGPILVSGEPKADSLVDVALAGLFVVLAAAAFIGGLGLLRNRPWARMLVMVLGMLHLLSFPLGTALGGYTLWFVLQSGMSPLLAPREPQRPSAP